MRALWRNGIANGKASLLAALWTTVVTSVWLIDRPLDYSIPAAVSVSLFVGAFIVLMYTGSWRPALRNLMRQLRHEGRRRAATALVLLGGSLDVVLVVGAAIAIIGLFLLSA